MIVFGLSEPCFRIDKSILIKEKNFITSTHSQMDHILGSALKYKEVGTDISIKKRVFKKLSQEEPTCHCFHRTFLKQLSIIFEPYRKYSAEDINNTK